MLGVHLNTMYWREMPGGLSDTDGQAVIGKRVAGQYEIYVGLMGLRFGAGTEHEYRNAVESYVNTGSPIYVCFGFCDESVKPHSLDASFAKVLEFKSDIGTPKKYGKAILYFTFADEQEFRRRVRDHLTQAVKEVRGRVSGGRMYGLPPRGA